MIRLTKYKKDDEIGGEPIWINPDALGIVTEIEDHSVIQMGFEIFISVREKPYEIAQEWMRLQKEKYRE